MLHGWTKVEEGVKKKEREEGGDERDNAIDSSFSFRSDLLISAPIFFPPINETGARESIRFRVREKSNMFTLR